MTSPEDGRRVSDYLVRKAAERGVEMAADLLDARATITTLRAERDALRAAIEDIDAHATPLGQDGDGFVAVGYAVSVGSLHRALAVARGTLPLHPTTEESRDE